MFVPRVIAFVAGCACLVAVVGFQDASAPVPSADKSTRELYMASCATCHGETGDGKGATVLERPARSFKDGGFSYGNTPEALLRTITHGIPGSLMPSFAGAVSEEQLEALAQYVITLGPPVLKVEAQDTVMRVHDRAVVVRGKLPPIVEGAPERPRGLLIGLPSGLTFEYRTDKVRLLGVRSGEFVDRSDWVGRGGDALQPLGKLVHVFDAGPHPFTLGPPVPVESGPLLARLVSTVIVKAEATITYDLVDADGEVVARVLETPAACTTALGPGWQRRFVLDKRREAPVAFQASPPDADGERVGDKLAFAWRRAGSKLGYDVVIVRGQLGDAVAERSTAFKFGLELTPKDDDSAWLVVELAGVALPTDAKERAALIENCARKLPQ